MTRAPREGQGASNHILIKIKHIFTVGILSVLIKVTRNLGSADNAAWEAKRNIRRQKLSSGLEKWKTKLTDQQV